MLFLDCQATEAYNQPITASGSSSSSPLLPDAALRHYIVVGYYYLLWSKQTVDSGEDVVQQLGEKINSYVKVAWRKSILNYGVQKVKRKLSQKKETRSTFNLTDLSRVVCFKS